MADVVYGIHRVCTLPAVEKFRWEIRRQVVCYLERYNIRCTLHAVHDAEELYRLYYTLSDPERIFIDLMLWGALRRSVLYRLDEKPCHGWGEAR